MRRLGSAAARERGGADARGGRGSAGDAGGAQRRAGEEAAQTTHAERGGTGRAGRRRRERGAWGRASRWWGPGAEIGEWCRRGARTAGSAHGGERSGRGASLWASGAYAVEPACGRAARGRVRRRVGVRAHGAGNCGGERARGAAAWRRRAGEWHWRVQRGIGIRARGAGEPLAQAGTASGVPPAKTVAVMVGAW
ncbi:hypothetical protein GCM10028799_24460 [Kribbella italica]